MNVTLLPHLYAALDQPLGIWVRSMPGEIRPLLAALARTRTAAADPRLSSLVLRLDPSRPTDTGWIINAPRPTTDPATLPDVSA